MANVHSLFKKSRSVAGQRIPSDEGEKEGEEKLIALSGATFIAEPSDLVTPSRRAN